MVRGGGGGGRFCGSCGCHVLQAACQHWCVMCPAASLLLLLLPAGALV